jgi:uncharacterized protein
MFKRLLTSTLQEELSFSPAVGLLGPRQVGKTTLALNVARNLQHIYLDLESERDRAKLAQPELYLKQHLDKYHHSGILNVAQLSRMANNRRLK